MKQKLILGLLISCFLSSIAYGDQLRILTCIEPPTNYTQDGVVKGTSVDIVNAIREKLGVKAEIEVLPWARAYETSLYHPNVVIFTAGKTQERIDYGFTFIGPVVSRQHGLFKLRRDPLEIHDLDDIKDQHLAVGGIIGDWRTNYLIKRDIYVESVTLYSQNFHKLIKKRLNLVISSDIELPIWAAEVGLTPDDFTLAFVIREAPSFIMLSAGTPTATIEAWQEAFEALKQDESFMRRVAEKWSRQLHFSMAFDPEKGFHILSPSG